MHDSLQPTQCSGRSAWSEFVAGIGTGTFASVVIVHVTTTLGYDTGPQGIVYAIGRVGSLVAAGLEPRLLARFGFYRMLVVALLADVPASALMAFAAPPSVLGYAMLVSQQVIGDLVATISRTGRACRLRHANDVDARSLHLCIAGACPASAGPEVVLNCCRCLGAT